MDQEVANPVIQAFLTLPAGAEGVEFREPFVRPFAPCLGGWGCWPAPIPFDRSCHPRSRISTTSLFAVPRFMTSCLPSRDKSKLWINSLLK